MTKTIDTLRTGLFVTFTEGTYSDYGIIGTFKVIKDVDLNLCWKVVKENSSQYEHSAYHSIIPFLLMNGYLEELDTKEFHLGDYGDFEPRIY